MKKPFDCDCIIREEPIDGADRRLFILNTTPIESLVHYGWLTGCPVCQGERKGAKEPSAIVLKLYVDDDGRVCLQWQKNGMDSLWVLRSDGAYLPGSNITSDLVRGLLLLTDTLKPTAVDDLPQTDQPVLYIDARCGVPGLRFRGTTSSLGGDGTATQSGGDVDLVALLYEAATAAPPDEKPGAIVLKLFVDQYDKVRLRLDCKGYDDVPWLLEPDGAYLPVEYGRERFDLSLALRGYANRLEPMWDDDIPQTDQPVLYKNMDDIVCLRVGSDTFAFVADDKTMWTGSDGISIRDDGTTKLVGGDINMVRWLYNAAKNAESPDEKPSVIVLGLHQDDYGEVCLRLHTENNKATWVLRQPHGARWLNDDGALEPCDLVAELRKHARRLDATAACDFPQTDRPVLFMSLAGVPNLRFMGDVYNLWGGGKATLAGSKVDLVSLLYNAAKSTEPPDEKPPDTPAAQALRKRVTGHLTLATPFRPIHVVWNDAVQHSGYFDLRDGDSFPLEAMETMGYLVGETPAAIVVAQSVSAHKAGDLLVIPRTAIVKMETTN